MANETDADFAGQRVVLPSILRGDVALLHEAVQGEIVRCVTDLHAGRTQESEERGAKRKIGRLTTLAAFLDAIRKGDDAAADRLYGEASEGF